MEYLQRIDSAGLHLPYYSRVAVGVGGIARGHLSASPEGLPQRLERLDGDATREPWHAITALVVAAACASRPDYSHLMVVEDLRYHRERAEAPRVA